MGGNPQHHYNYILYKGWVQEELGPIDLEQWVLENSERVQKLRDDAVANMMATAEARKHVWNNKAQVREFQKGDKVYLRKPGINTKLSESWAGPYTVTKRNSPLSYRVNTGDRTLQSVDIQQLKLCTPREPDKEVKRVTTVLERDSVTDTMENQYAEVTLSGTVQAETREADVVAWETEYKDILTKDPRITTLAEFRIDMGDHPPICPAHIIRLKG